MESFLKKVADAASNSIFARNEILGRIESFCPKCGTNTSRVWKAEGA